MRRAPAPLTCLSLSLAAALLAGCTGGSAPPPTPSAQTPATSAASDEPVALSLLVFNVEYGGSPATDAVIADLDADVVGVLESYSRLPEIAEETGYPYYNVGLQILSKYPILEPSGADGLYAYLEVRPGEAVAMINTHLDYVQYGPIRLERGVPVADVLATEEEVRLSSVEKLLPSATRLLDDDWPLLFTGDLNQPSHLDGPIAWPVSEALIGTGLRDSYRELHPDPLADPGHTWGGVGDTKGLPDRIDYAYVGGPVEVESSEVVGERGGPGVDRGYGRWTSDHRAVLAQLAVEPVPIPTTVALSSRLVTAGDDLAVTYRMPEADGTITLSGPSSASYDATGASGTVEVPTESLPGGAYRVDLVNGGGGVVATNDLYVRRPDAQVALTTDESAYAVGDPVTVRWSDGPANRWDWIGVYPAGAADPEQDSYLLWGYTGGHDSGALPPSPEGELVLGRDHQGRPWPLPPGRYIVHYLPTDQYVSIGSASFTVGRPE